MVRKNGRKKLIIAAAILGVLLVAVGTVALIRAMNPKNNDPYVQENTSKSEQVEDASTGADSPNATQKNTPQNTANQPSNESATLDPATVRTIDISPMSLTVSYVTGVGAFEYEVLRTPNGTQYVEFKSGDLVGTKCTDDAGVFASIIQSPSSSETNATVSKTVELSETKYGLALSGTNCTSNVDLLTQYQESFSKAFTLLKKTN